LARRPRGRRLPHRLHKFAGASPREQLLDLLNAYADCLVGVVHAHDGKVMKVMSEGIVGAFDGAKGDACRSTFDAVRARFRMATSAAGTGSTSR
jgi:class 3 adenylate cyclase